MRIATSGLVWVLLIWTLWGCSDKSEETPKGEAPISAREIASTAGATPSTNSAAEACLNVEDTSKMAIADTTDFLGELDKLRTAAFQPEFELPKLPVEPPDEPCATRFAQAPQRDAYAEASKTYSKALKKVDRELGRYAKTFNADWSWLDLSENGKSTALGDAAKSKGLTKMDAACLVQEIGGSCRRACFYKHEYAANGVMREDSRACRDGFGWWAQVCNAEFLCATETPLANRTPGIEYSASSYQISYSSRFKEDDPAAADFQKTVASIGYGEVVQFPAVSGWYFDDGWVASASPDTGALSRIGDNAACCEAKVVAARQAQVETE